MFKSPPRMSSRPKGPGVFHINREEMRIEGSSTRVTRGATWAYDTPGTAMSR